MNYISGSWCDDKHHSISPVSSGHIYTAKTSQSNKEDKRVQSTLLFSHTISHKTKANFAILIRQTLGQKGTNIANILFVVKASKMARNLV